MPQRCILTVSNAAAGSSTPNLKCVRTFRFERVGATTVFTRRAAAAADGVGWALRDRQEPDIDEDDFLVELDQWTQKRNRSRPLSAAGAFLAAANNPKADAMSDQLNGDDDLMM